MTIGHTLRANAGQARDFIGDALYALAHADPIALENERIQAAAPHLRRAADQLTQALEALGAEPIRAEMGPGATR